MLSGNNIFSITPFGKEIYKNVIIGYFDLGEVHMRVCFCLQGVYVGSVAEKKVLLFYKSWQIFNIKINSSAFTGSLTSSCDHSLTQAPMAHSASAMASGSFCDYYVYTLNSTK